MNRIRERVSILTAKSPVVLLITSLAALSVGHAASESAYSPGTPYLLEREATGGLSLRIVRLRLFQNGDVLDMEHAKIEADSPLDLEITWLPLSLISSSVPFRIVFWDGLGLISRDFTFRAGPVDPVAEWVVGAEYTQRVTVSSREFANFFSGQSYLEIDVDAVRHSERAFRPLMLVPIEVMPLLSQVQIAEGAVRRAVGEDVHLLPKQAKLGMGASIAMSVPKHVQEGNKALAVVSSLSYRGKPQGEQVAVIILQGANGETAELSLRSGIETARCDYDAYPPGRFLHEKVTVFSSRDSAQLNRSGQPVQLNNYIGLLDIPPELTAITEITVRCTSEVVMHLQGMSLVR